MHTVRVLPRPIAVVLALMLALLLAVPLMGAKGSNATAAKACQKSGYASLATSEDPYTAFPNQDACVSYAAKGGTLTTLIAYHGSVRFVWDAAREGCVEYFDATIPAGTVGIISVTRLDGSTSTVEFTRSHFSSYGGILIYAGATMTAASGEYYSDYTEPHTPFPVTFDPEPCGPGSTAG